MIEVRNLVYEYPTSRALDGVSLRIESGAITALVGPNGAGKSTLMRCMAALEAPYAGEVLIDGVDTRKAPREIHRKLAFLPDFFGLYDQLTVERCLIFAARAHGLGGEQIGAAVRKAAIRVGLDDRMQARAAELSRGLRQRLAIAQAIVHEPKVILLDEPASGLDPDARRSLSALFLELKSAGMTLVVSSHILSELEDYSSSMLIIRDGRLVGGEAMQLRPETFAFTLELAAPTDGFPAFLAARPGVLGVSADGAAARIELDSPDRRADLVAAIVAEGFPLVGFAPERRSLEQLYMEQAGKGAS